MVASIFTKYNRLLALAGPYRYGRQKERVTCSDKCPAWSYCLKKGNEFNEKGFQNGKPSPGSERCLAVLDEFLGDDRNFEPIKEVTEKLQNKSHIVLVNEKRQEWWG